MQGLQGDGAQGLVGPVHRSLQLECRGPPAFSVGFGRETNTGFDLDVFEVEVIVDTAHRFTLLLCTAGQCRPAGGGYYPRGGSRWGRGNEEEVNAQFTGRWRVPWCPDGACRPPTADP